MVDQINGLVFEEDGRTTTYNNPLDYLKRTIVFADLDGTLIKTKSGRTFPKDTDDWVLREDVIDKIAKVINPTYLFIVSNQGGIPRGLVKEEEFKKKLETICDMISGRLKIHVHGEYSATEDKEDPNRKPNTGMLRKCLAIFTEKTGKQLIANSNMIMIGDASGFPGQFSDSDLKTAENFGIDYIDADELVKMPL
jgi:DNA 3'-phosphatase